MSAVVGPNVAAMSYVVRIRDSPPGLTWLPSRAARSAPSIANLALAQVRTLQDIARPRLGADGVHDGPARDRRRRRRCCSA